MVPDNVGKTTSSQLTKAMNPLDPETPPNECLTIEFTSPKKPKEAYKSLARLTDQTLSPRTRAEHSWNICRFMEKQVTEIAAKNQEIKRLQAELEPKKPQSKRNVSSLNLTSSLNKDRKFLEKWPG